MKKNKKIKLAGVLLGAALTSTGSFAASGSCGAGKCGSEPKKIEQKGSCGAGKCGSSDKKELVEKDEMSGNQGKKTEMACGAGKCGASMNKKVEGSCGAGKCG